MNFNVNPQLDLDNIKKEYSTDHRVRVDQLLPEDQALTLSQTLAELSDYRHAFVVDENYGEASDEELKNLSAEDRKKLIASIMTQAANGVGFWYERYAIKKDNEGLLGDLFNWLNSDTILNLVAQLTGVEEYRSAIAQATRYRRGDFLTRHQDVVTKEERKVAFVINLSPRWHPDWGGLLQFYEINGTPRDTWAPDFNSLSLFDVSHVHSVTCVSPFTPDPRLAVSGWFRLA